MSIECEMGATCLYVACLSLNSLILFFLAIFIHYSIFAAIYMVVRFALIQ